ncbi:MAG: enoyl-CoA hydratase-related protein [Dehalococcoidia bacterium]|nr:enoyl-CoA hydratase-related protein [Dehalococcoidia bacterium]
MEYKTILFEIRDNVARITLNRTDAANSLNSEMSKDLFYASIECSENPAVRAVLITGNGRFFCSGGDLKSFSQQGDALPAHLKEMTTYLHAAISRFVRMDSPVIAAVNGTAAGAGLSIVCACDLAIAAENASFTMAYTRVGLVPDGSSTYFLPRIVGIKRALDLALTNRVFTAREALEWGIVNRVVPAERLMPEADSLAAQFVSGPKEALGKAKKLLYLGINNSLETQMELESQEISAIVRTTDAKEGVKAFLEKRLPKYGGI